MDDRFREENLLTLTLGNNQKTLHRLAFQLLVESFGRYVTPILDSYVIPGSFPSTPYSERELSLIDRVLTKSTKASSKLGLETSGAGSRASAEQFVGSYD